VPVFLLFRADDLLTRIDVSFTDGNFARLGSCRHGSTAGFLESLNFRDIYHDDVLPNDFFRKNEIIFARNAEVLVAGELDLGDLDQVVCRTGGEMETLLYLLGDQAPTWKDRIRLERLGETLFYRDFAFITQVQLIGPAIHGTARAVVGTYHLSVKVWNEGAAPIVDREHTIEGFPARFAIKLPALLERARVQIMVEGDSLAYDAVVSKQQIFSPT